MPSRTRKCKESLDYHEGMTPNQVKILLKELNLDPKKFNEWINGQTCPILMRYDQKGRPFTEPGFYEYDVYRWISNQLRKAPLIFD